MVWHRLHYDIIIYICNKGYELKENEKCKMRWEEREGKRLEHERMFFMRIINNIGFNNNNRQKFD